MDRTLLEESAARMLLMQPLLAHSIAIALPTLLQIDRLTTRHRQYSKRHRAAQHTS